MSLEFDNDQNRNDEIINNENSGIQDSVNQEPVAQNPFDQEPVDQEPVNQNVDSEGSYEETSFVLKEDASSKEDVSMEESTDWYNPGSVNAGSTGTNQAADGNYYKSEARSYNSTRSYQQVVDDEPMTDAEKKAAEKAAKKAAKQEKKASKKSGGFFKKAIALLLAAVLFGGAAGGTMVGVQVLAKKMGVLPEAETQGTTIHVAESTSTTSSSGSSALADVSDIVDKVLPSVVAITNSQIYESYQNQYGNDWSDFFNYYFGGNGYGYGNGYGNYGNRGNSNGNSSSQSDQQEVEAGSGSGIIIGQNDTEILIVTNYHVIEDADSLTITFCDSTTAKAVVKGTDSDNDLAVVAVKIADLAEGTSDNIAIATLDTSDDCKVGQGVIAIGNALGYGQSITVGYISALDRAVSTSDGTTKNLLQTDAAINPGNSGGALVNTRGEIIGINSAKYSDTDVEGMGFAIPISKVYNIIDDLMNRETKEVVAEEERGYLGINVYTVDESTSQAYGFPVGVYVNNILEGGAASKSELQAYDIITKLNGEKVTTREELSELLTYYKIGDKVTLTVSRLIDNEYKEVEVEVTLAAQVG